MKLKMLWLGILIACSLLARPSPAHAATITVPCDVNALINAITTANANAGADTLELAANCAYTLTSVNNTDPLSDNGLPKITSEITINARGATWQTAGAPLNPFDANRVVAVTRDLVWIGHDFGISRTTNGGATWELLATGCPSGGYCYAITAAGTRHAWASDLAFAPPGRLFRWVNADHWEMQTVPANSSVIIISFVGARR